MQCNLPQGVINNMVDFAKKNNVSKVILFGSRACGTNTERSDINIAVTGGDFDRFYRDITENANSLL